MKFVTTASLALAIAFQCALGQSQHINLSFSDTNLSQVLKAISMRTGASIVYSDESSGDAAKKRFAQFERVAVLGNNLFENLYRFACDFGADTVTGDSEYVELHGILTWLGANALSFLGLAADAGDGVVADTFHPVGQFAEAVIDEIELFLGEFKAQIGTTILQRMAAAVFA